MIQSQAPGFLKVVKLIFDMYFHFVVVLSLPKSKKKQKVGNGADVMALLHFQHFCM
jgi:hypothetical protein